MQSEDNGILVIDKPAGMSSAQVVAVVKGEMRARKVGHAGTLDPFATGVLVCCVNRATRLAGYLLKGRKTYAATLHLGVSTDTQDATGAILAQAAPETVRYSEPVLRAAFERFVGAIDQQPPAFSALKLNGVPLYRLARQGRPVRKPARRVQITSIEIRRIDLPRVQFEVTCSAGTYIRTLCADLGELLGCGGHLAALRRLASSGFTLDQALTIEDFNRLARQGRAAKRLIPMTAALEAVPAFRADERLMARLRHGQPIAAGDIAPAVPVAPGELVKVEAPDGGLAALLRRGDLNAGYEYCAVFVSAAPPGGKRCQPPSRVGRKPGAGTPAGDPGKPG